MDKTIVAVGTLAALYFLEVLGPNLLEKYKAEREELRFSRNLHTLTPDVYEKFNEQRIRNYPIIP